jgi:transposase
MDNQANVVGARPGDAERPRESDVAALGRGGRMSRQRKTAAVLRLLRGEDLETVSRALGVTAATLTGWHDAFLVGGEAALTSRPGSGEELESNRLKARLGAALIERDLLNEKIALLEAGRPFAGASHEPRHIAGQRQALWSGRGLPRLAAGPLRRLSAPEDDAAAAAARSARRDVG